LFGALASFSEETSKHAVFHVEAAKVADAINGKKHAEASAILEAATAFASASGAVGAPSFA
jgi:methyl-accepting chemotaxis protein